MLLAVYRRRERPVTQNSQDSQVLSYGDHPDQHLTLVHSRVQPSRGTAVLVHGGYWRQRINAAVMQPMLEDLLQAGWNVANVEYRRGPEHPWPTPSVDVALAIELIRSTLRREDRPDRLVLIGHSVGGQLVLLNADRADAVVGLAPVTNAIKVFEEDLGDSAAKEYFERTPSDAPTTYRQASPCHQPSPAVPMLLVHGQDDDRVPLEHTRQYIQSLGDKAQQTAMFHPHLDHFEAIDPKKHHWDAVRNWMTRASADAQAE
ncbi:alpha/beta hydrolase [Arthrobacter sp. MYb211]|nr:alpha/beta hydrolase [Arthrobacter sp. MYb221]PRC10315.1 alpha/beta hydrolase [Arthrobacter sp. MYb211]